MSVKRSVHALLSSLRGYKAYWKPMLVLLLATTVYIACAGDVQRLKEAVDAQGGHPSVDLAADVSINFLARVICLGLIAGASLRASAKTVLASISCVAFAVLLALEGRMGHAVAAGVLSAVCLGITWAAIDETASVSKANG